jgi:hypothetical protein
MNIFKFKLILFTFSFLVFGLANGKEKKDLDEQLRQYLADIANSDNPPPLAEVTHLIQSHKAKWIKELPQSRKEYATMIDELRTTNNSENLRSANEMEKTLDQNIKTNSDAIDSDVVSLLRVSLNSFLKSAFIDEYGVFSGETTSSGAEGNREISNEFKTTVGKVKNDNLKLLQWAKDKYPEEFSQALNGTDLYNALISQKEPVTQFSDVAIGTRSPLDQDTCFSKKDLGLMLIINVGLAHEKQFAPCEQPKSDIPIAFDCFPSGSFFRNTLESTKKNQSYFFAEGTSKGEINTPDETYNPDAQKASTKSCVFLGGNWSLDKQDPTKIAKGSKVKILTPDNQTKTLLSDDLTALRKTWEDERTKFQLEHATAIVCAAQIKKKCGF